MALRAIRNEPADKPGLRMNELMAATGLPRSTLAHYVKEGLLLPPVKTSVNMAYYAPESVERVRFIQAMKARHLPLGKIKTLLALRDKGLDPWLVVELNQVIFGPSEATMDRAEFVRETGLTDDQLASLLEAGLLLPLEPDRFDRQDAALGAFYAQALAQGVSPGDFSFYVRYARLIVAEEMQFRRRITAGLSFEREAEITSQLVRSVRALRGYILDRCFQREVAARQERRLRELVEEDGETKPDSDRE
ncbi:MAG: MerR family transcriptional regulator [Proteobacteria bacterium]|nr:MerR family transcriptional regulator [Pseudomonadota bacterium]